MLQADSFTKYTFRAAQRLTYEVTLLQGGNSLNFELTQQDVRSTGEVPIVTLSDVAGRLEALKAGDTLRVEEDGVTLISLLPGYVLHYKAIISEECFVTQAEVVNFIGTEEELRAAKEEAFVNYMREYERLRLVGKALADNP